MQLAIDAADDIPGIALAVDGVVGMMATWATNRNHSVELLPNIDRLLTEAGRSKADVEAVFVDVGPGGYAALRVGVSIAKALAHGLAVPIVGVSRLELDAYTVGRDAARRTIIALHRSGRDEVAWAGYHEAGDGWHELSSPRVDKIRDLTDIIDEGVAVTGDLDDELLAAAVASGASVVSPHEHRVIALAAIGHQRLGAGRIDDAMAVVPLYLRAPAIGPQGA